MSKVADSVLNSIVSGCKAEARKQVKKELGNALEGNKFLRKENTRLRKDIRNKEKKIKILMGELKQISNPLCKREQTCQKREQSLRKISSLILKNMKENNSE